MNGAAGTMLLNAEGVSKSFGAMRALDDNSRVSELYAAKFPAHGLGHAINERLERAAG